MSLETLGESLDFVIGGKSAVVHSPSAKGFMEMPVQIATDHDAVIDGIYAFAGQFVGHEGNELKDEKHIDPMSIPLQKYLDFYAAVDTIYVMANTESERASFIQFVRKHQLEEVRQSIGEDAERVSEALLISIGEKLSASDPALAKLMGKLEAQLDAETDAEDAHSNATTAYALNATSSNPTPSIIAMGQASDAEEDAEARRVSTTNKIFQKNFSNT